jgi:hypothetical protein
MPRCARSMASVNPTGPPPTISTSVSMIGVMRSRLWDRGMASP